jgi:putative membrane-bound dehydrogenase-like protein
MPRRPFFARRASLLGLVLALSTVAPAWAQKSPEDELKSLTVPEGAELSLFASEPMITNPAAIDIDTHGRVWVAEIQWYRRAAKNPPADKIKVLEDTDGDGRADKATVFAEDLFAPMSICVAGDKVYVATSPDLWVYEDKNGDLRADGPPKKLLTGFGGFNHDHGAHSIVLGPDHKWWMAHGDAGYKVTGVEGSQIEFPAGGMIRGELDGTKLENVATNFRNPYEIAVSSFGEAFCSDNDNDGNFSVRICWILEGGNYGWYKRPGPKFPPGTPFGDTWHFRGAIPGFVPSTVVTGFGSPCGMCYYEGDAFPKLKNMPLHCDAGPREVRAYPHEKAGAGFKGSQVTLITSQDDNYFRPDDICTAPDGSLYIADWYDGGVGGHAYNNPDQGRIFRLTPKDKQLKRRERPGPYESLDDATVGLHSPNLATQFLARERLLAGGGESVPKLIHQFENSDDNAKARSLWLLDRIGGDGRAYVVKQLRSKEPAMQALAVRILRRHHDDEKVMKEIGFTWGTNWNAQGELLREYVLAARHLPWETASDIWARTLTTGRADDRYLDEALRISIPVDVKRSLIHKCLDKLDAGMGGVIPSRQAIIDPAKALARDISALEQPTSSGDFDSRAAIDRLGLKLDLKAFDAVVNATSRATAHAELRHRSVEWLTFNCAPAGLWSGIVGEADASVSAWTTQYETGDKAAHRAKLVACAKQLLGEGDYQADALKLAAGAGLTELGPEVLALVSGPDTPGAVRDQALAMVVQTRPTGAGEALAKLLKSEDEGLRTKAAAALVEMAQFTAVKSLVVKGAEVKNASATAERMVQTTGGALALLKWIDAKEVDDAVAKLVVAKAINHPDANVRILFEKFVPENERPQRLGSAMKAADILKLTGDEKRGEQIFHQSSAANCKNCHAVRGFGKKLGPDLTTIGKKYEKAALLETIMEPSKAISHEYMTSIVETDEGLAYTGFVEKNEKVVLIRTAEDKTIRVPAKNVESITPSPKSMMPELVLKEVTAQDAADLLAYLMTLKEPLPAK